ncbi:MAG: response regulator transcription factor, partial [Thioalkalivibrio sp.]|nr:response regulator transcription factor [Thioalkalivibrio sp.]
SYRILIIEDESAISMPIRDRLENEGYRVAVAADGTAGLDLALQGRFDAILLDLMLPGIDGMELCHELRTSGNHTPVLMLTARAETHDKVSGLKTGADDYLTKPFEMVELLARIEAPLRRGGTRASPEQTVYVLGACSFDLRRQEVTRGSEVIPLATQEFKLLKYFCEHRGEVIDRDELLRAVWGYDSAVYSRTVDVHVAWLRQKLDDRDSPSIITTIRGRGYKFRAE